MSAPFPPGTRLVADPTLRLRSAGRIMLGGSPLRFFRLTEGGAALVRRWLGGEPPGAKAGAAKLARRLVGAGMVHPHPPEDVAGPAVTVVIPVKNDQTGLNSTLAGLSHHPVTIVDDGSLRPLGLPAAQCDHEPILLRRDQAGGPGVARQAGLETVNTPLVAFVDAGVSLTDVQLQRLCRWFTDPEVVAVGPRVQATAGPDLIDRYEQAHSPLDLGPNPSPVGHGRTVSYLPTACLIARSDVVRAVGGFDPDLRFGEDVDLVWRLLDHGQVRYDPSVAVSHPARATVAELAGQRFGYGLAAAPLAQRHGSELAPVRVSAWSLGVWGLALSGHGLLALALAGYTASALSKKLSRSLPDHQIEAALLTARGHWYAGLSLADAATRIWWPAFALGALTPAGRPVRLLAALGWLNKIRRTTGPPVDRLAHMAMMLIDDGAYGAGVWVGASRHRSARCLLPLIVNWPPKDDTTTER